MSIHPSLKTKPAGLNQHRNVLTRTERVAKLMERGDFDPESDSPTGLVKIANRRHVTKKKKKAEEGDAAEATDATAES